MVKKLLFTHFDANIYQNFKEKKKAWVPAKKIFNNVIMATDYLQIEV